jgi:hypothetical protein
LTKVFDIADEGRIEFGDEIDEVESCFLLCGGGCDEGLRGCESATDGCREGEEVVWHSAKLDGFGLR